MCWSSAAPESRGSVSAFADVVSSAFAASRACSVVVEWLACGWVAGAVSCLPPRTSSMFVESDVSLCPRACVGADPGLVESSRRFTDESSIPSPGSSAIPLVGCLPLALRCVAPALK